LINGPVESIVNPARALVNRGTLHERSMAT